MAVSGLVDWLLADFAYQKASIAHQKLSIHGGV